MTPQEKFDLWHRLRNDPDFEPSWLRAMGPKPPEPGAEHVTWGDGHLNKREHLIAEVSFNDGYVMCTCGQTLWESPTLSNEDMWDIHRGAGFRVEERALNPVLESALADDDEVSAFLTAVSNPLYEVAL